MTIAIERETSGGTLDFNGNGVAGCAVCGWRGVPPIIDGERSTFCPACEPETRIESPAKCEDCGGACIEQRTRDGRRWGDLQQGDLYRPGAVVIPFRRPKVGRNEPCPCGSGRKFKRCCGAAA